MPAQKPGRSKQDYATPRPFLDAVERRAGPIQFDLAAHRGNNKHARYFAPSMLVTKVERGKNIAGVFAGIFAAYRNEVLALGIPGCPLCGRGLSADHSALVTIEGIRCRLWCPRCEISETMDVEGDRFCAAPKRAFNELADAFAVLRDELERKHGLVLPAEAEAG